MHNAKIDDKGSDVRSSDMGESTPLGISNSPSSDSELEYAVADATPTPWLAEGRNGTPTGCTRYQRSSVYEVGDADIDIEFLDEVQHEIKHMRQVSARDASRSPRRLTGIHNPSVLRE